MFLVKFQCVLFFEILSTYRTFQVSAKKVRSDSKEEGQDQGTVVMADNIKKAEEDARQAVNKVRNKGLITVLY